MYSVQQTGCVLTIIVCPARSVPSYRPTVSRWQCKVLPLYSVQPARCGLNINTVSSGQCGVLPLYSVQLLQCLVSSCSLDGLSLSQGGTGGGARRVQSAWSTAGDWVTLQAAPSSPHPPSDSSVTLCVAAVVTSLALATGDDVVAS